MDAPAQAYIDGIDIATRPLFDRVHELITGEFPDVEVSISYKMPVYRREGRSLNVGAWKHGISFYGWPDQQDLAILRSHPELSSGKGTLRITPGAAAEITDPELLELIRASLA